MTVEILRIYEDYITTIIVLVAPHFQNQRRNVETRVECLFEVFLHVFQKERWHVSQSSSRKSIRAAIDRFLRFFWRPEVTSLSGRSLNLNKI